MLTVAVCGPGVLFLLGLFLFAVPFLYLICARFVPHRRAVYAIAAHHHFYEVGCNEITT